MSKLSTSFGQTFLRDLLHWKHVHGLFADMHGVGLRHVSHTVSTHCDPKYSRSPHSPQCHPQGFLSDSDFHCSLPKWTGFVQVEQCSHRSLESRSRKSTASPSSGH